MKMETIKTADQARQKAIDWQNWVSEQNLSIGELAVWHSYFERMAKKFKLTDEFVENGVI